MMRRIELDRTRTPCEVLLSNCSNCFRFENFVVAFQDLFWRILIGLDIRHKGKAPRPNDSFSSIDCSSCSISQKLELICRCCCCINHFNVDIRMSCFHLCDSSLIFSNMLRIKNVEGSSCGIFNLLNPITVTTSDKQKLSFARCVSAVRALRKCA